MGASTLQVAAASGLLHPLLKADSFTAPNALPEGFCYRPNVLSGDEEDGLAHGLADLPFKPFDFHGYLANRQVVSFGYRCDYDRRAVVGASPFPSFLVSLRNKVAAIFDRPAGAFRQVLINEYRPGAGSGWHRDKTQFDEVVGVWLLALCVLRFRRKAAETWDRVSLAVEPCGLIFFRGPRPHRVGAQLSRARSASLFNHLADARCEGAFW